MIRDEIEAAGAPPFPELPRSDELTDTPERMRHLLETAGLTDVATTSRPLDARFDPASALAMRTGSGNLGWRFAQLPPLRQDRVLHRAADRLAALEPDAFVDRSEVLLTTAVRGWPPPVLGPGDERDHGVAVAEVAHVGRVPGRLRALDS